LGMIITLKIDTRPKSSGLNPIFFKLSHGKSGTTEQVRKKIYIGIDVSLKQFDPKNFRAKSRHANHEIINERLKQLKEIKNTCETKFDAGLYTISQAINHLSGKSNIDSVDDYIEQIIQESKSRPTYLSYFYTLGAFKKHLGFASDKRVTFNEFSNYTLLNKFKREAITSGATNNSINSYFTKIRAVLNDAFLNQYTFEKFTLHKGLRMPKPYNNKIETCSVEMFVKAIDKCKTIYQIQSLGFYLLMFATRGMYPADIVQIQKFNLRDVDSDLDSEFNSLNKGVIKDEIYKLQQSGVNFLVHNRSKNRNRSNAPMLIRIDQQIHKLFIWLKLSVILTHHNRVEVLGSYDDSLSIFNYNTDEAELHNNIWNVYSKHCKKILGHSFKNARKSFSSHAMKLKISADVRQILLGHKNLTMLQYYDDLGVLEEEVNEAHIGVLKAFEVEALVDLIEAKFNQIDRRICTMLPPYEKYVSMLLNKSFKE
jgi:hypothetical protein